MVSLSPTPSPAPEPERRRKWLDEETTLTNAQLLELRQVLEQQGDAIDDLKAARTALLERVRALETANDDFDRTLAVHDDRLDALEATAGLVSPPPSVELAPQLLVARPIDPRETPLQELHDALETVVAGLLAYRRLGVAAGSLDRLCAIACAQADVRFTRERHDNAVEDAAAEAWLAEGRAS